MKVILADHSGFCFGVEKAIDAAFKEVENSPDDQKIYTLGPLIHNEQVVAKLKERGVDVRDTISQVDDGKVIIRSHGVPESVYKLARAKSLDIIDATCPFVKKIQKIVKEYYQKGYTICIIGDPNHPEVIGINGWCDDKAYIINHENDVGKLPEVDHLCIVVQTTMSNEQFEILSHLVEMKGKIIAKFNTICSATKERQSAAEDLAKKVDAMIVVGGFHSSNTQKLVSICKNVKPLDTYHVETPEEIPVEQLKRYGTIGITAGASTPKWIIQGVVEKLNSI